jgi:hypothetical protein
MTLDTVVTERSRAREQGGRACRGAARRTWRFCREASGPREHEVESIKEPCDLNSPIWSAAEWALGPKGAQQHGWHGAGPALDAPARQSHN